MTTTNTLTVQQAIAQALAEEMRRDPRVLTFGEGVATKHAALQAEFGAARVRNTPLAEAIIAGTAAGTAAMGLRPVIDLLFAPFMTLAMDAIVNSAGKLRYLSGGQFEFPLVVLAMTGAGWGVGGQHNHNLEAMFVHAPGLKVLMPSTPADFHGLLKAAIREPNPVLVFVDLALLHTSGPVPAGDKVLPIGRAEVRRPGDDLTLVGYGKTVGSCLQAAGELAGAGIEAEVIDLRSLKPLDTATVLGSVRRTGRLLVVHEAAAPCGLGAELIALASERAFGALKAPPLRITGPDAPAPASWALEQAGVPQPQAVVQAAQRLCSHGTRQAVPA
jgi:acetoin:2,6-dichlorophenolindophenol oxidoreductase subunit beta